MRPGSRLITMLSALGAVALSMAMTGAAAPTAVWQSFELSSPSVAGCARVAALARTARPSVLSQADRGTPPTDSALRFDHISAEQGLSESTVYCIFQDSQGFLWFCTTDGLNRYDGTGMRVYTPTPEPNSIGARYTRSVCESPEGTLWIATLGAGLNRLNLKTDQFTQFRAQPSGSGPSSDWITALFCEEDGSLWLGTTGQGIDHYDPQSRRFTNYRHVEGDPRSLAEGEVHAITRDRQGRLWIGTDGGLERGDPVRQRFVHYGHNANNPSSLSGNSVRAIFEDGDGALWIGTDGGLSRYEGEGKGFTHYRNDPADGAALRGSLSDNSVRAIFEDRYGVLWVGTDDGLNQFDAESGQFLRYRHDVNDPTSLSANWVWSIYEDWEGVLWFGTYNGGVNRHDRFSNRFARYQVVPGSSDSLSSNQIWAVCEDRAANLWLGTGGAGLDKLDRAKGVVTNYRHSPSDPNSLGHDVVRAVIGDSEGMIWIGTDGGGLDRLDPESGVFTHYRHDPSDPASLPGDSVRVLYEDRDGRLWIGLTRAGLVRFDREIERFVRYEWTSSPPKLLASDVWSITEDRQGTLWVGSAGSGLHEYSRAEDRFIQHLHDPSDIVLGIHEDRWGQLWVATYGNGLYLYNRGSETFGVFGVADGLPSDAIYSIMEDDEGYLWLSTNQGLSRLDPHTMDFRNYSASDGLQSDELSTGAYYRSRSGEMFVGGINGLNAFFPEQIQEENSFVPPVVLTSLTQGGETLEVGRAPNALEAFTLEWPNNFFEFEFAALSFSRPQKNQYAYMLAGFDEEWNFLGTRSFGRYTNLPGGTYTLRLKGSNGEGVWNEEGAAIELTVVPPFWQTWTFRGIAAAVLLASAVAVYRQRVSNVEARSRRLEQEVEERTQEIERRRRVAEGLREILAVLNSDRPLDEVLDFIVGHAGKLLEAEATVLHRLDEEEEQVTLLACSGLVPELSGLESIPFEASWADEAMVSQQPTLVADLATKAAAESELVEDEVAKRWLSLTGQYYRSFLAVPLIIDGAASHCLAFYYARTQELSDEELGLAIALADQTALAIENARLYEHAKELAVLEERQRLARDLHDAVTQTLFSASLIAEALPEIWADSPDEAWELLGKLGQLSRGALAEMRTLLMELRPTALVETSLRDLLRQLAQAVMGREGIPVELSVDEGCDLPETVHVALYRIAQEALNNVVKHAQASRAEIELVCTGPTAGDLDSRTVKLRIRDDGCGFDASRGAPERLGLGIMQERAESVGGKLEIDSEPGEGTTIAVRWTDGNA